MSDQLQKFIPLHDWESAALMREQSGKPQALCLAFGTGGVALQPRKSPWAVPLLLQWRGVTFNDGAGI